MVTKEQERARHALDKSKQLLAGDKDFVKKLPVLIKTCGLAQALAFVEAKGKAPNLHSALEEWIRKAVPLAQAGPSSILGRIVDGKEPEFLLRATNEALAYLFWVGRFSEKKEGSDAAKGSSSKAHSQAR